jgi:hypothetical protein
VGQCRHLSSIEDRTHVVHSLESMAKSRRPGPIRCHGVRLLGMRYLSSSLDTNSSISSKERGTLFQQPGMISAFEPTCRPHVHVVEDEEEEEMMVESVGKMSDNCRPVLICKQTPNLGLPRSVIIGAWLKRLLFSFCHPTSALTLAVAFAFSEPIQQFTARLWPTSSWFS